MKFDTRFGRRVLGVVALVVVLAVVVPFVVYGVPQVVGADASYTVVSGSMQPLIDPGDAVIVTETRPATIVPGDVITFTREGTNAPITHRVVGITEDGNGKRAFITKGDNNEDADQQAVSRTQLVGRVTLTIPYIGHVVLFANTQYGFVLLVAVPVVSLLLNEGWTTLRRDPVDPEVTAAAAAAESGITFADTGQGDEAEADGASDADRVIAAEESATGSGLDSSPTLALSKRDLSVTMLVLGAVAIYAAVVVWQLRAAWTVTALVAVLGTLLFVAAIRRGLPDGAVALEGDGTLALVPTNRIVTGSLPASMRSHARSTVDSLDELVSMAREADGWIVTDGSVCALPVDGTLYVCPAPAGDAGADDTTDTERIDEWTATGDDDRDGGSSVVADGGEQ